MTPTDLLAAALGVDLCFIFVAVVTCALADGPHRRLLTFASDASFVVALLLTGGIIGTVAHHWLG